MKAVLIEGSFLNKTIFEKVSELERLDYFNLTKVIPVAIPSTNALKKAFLKMNGKKNSYWKRNNKKE